MFVVYIEWEWLGIIEDVGLSPPHVFMFTSLG